MTDTILKNLAQQSYTRDQLDQSAVDQIAKELSRKDLKKYISLLKEVEKKKEVYITSAEKLSVEDINKIQNLFPNKKLVTTIDSSMINGVKIVENDQEYEINLNRTFHDIIRFLSKND